ncbi:MAG TPA: c-type cytochrome [Gemmatimonadaceae bacterium]|nr:c-type cytochrome [Gemmatimonadaceae bacterium]
MSLSGHEHPAEESAEGRTHALRERLLGAPPGRPRHPWWWIGGGTALLLALAGVMGAHELSQRRSERMHDARELTGGEPSEGPALMRAYGCGGCHTIPGVPGADGTVGPPLTGFARRQYIGGVALNEPNTLVEWILNPKQFDPKTAMPVTGVTREQARHIAAFLYTLR